ncbi:ABC transporter permease [Christensenella sp. MSJ-20]|uniref:ABC transporter permease n=1 Tax=Christensenella sp. MSJ-20 TaxID=2841518 RepID=UPI001C7539D8|nr:ABC transporter permease [Christensenella sp. MSJ-20]
MKKRSRRKAALSLLILSLCLLLAVTLAGVLLRDAAMETDFARKNLPPSLRYPFGTDWMGRDLFVRTLCGLSMSIQIGIITASVSAVIAFLLGSAAALLGRGADAAVSWLIDLMMGIPHILLLILVSFACGKGFWGVVIGVTLSHWMSLSRVIRGEVLQLRESGYVQVAQKLGMGRGYILRRHMVPHLFPQFMVGLVLLFPHAILHEASVTFLGFGLSPEQPAIGVILSEGMKYLIMGQWWLAVFPGLALVLVVLLFDLVGSTLRKLLDPASIHE